MKYGKVWLVFVLSLLLFDSASLQAAGHQNQTNRVLVVDHKGWHNWDNRDNERTARYKEYGSTGTGSNVANRVKWSNILTKNEASQITVQAVLGGTDG